MSCIRMAKMPVESEGRESFWASFHCVAYAGHWILLRHGLRTPNEAFFSSKSQTFELGQTIWADRFWGIWGTYCLYI